MSARPPIRPRTRCTRLLLLRAAVSPATTTDGTSFITALVNAGIMPGIKVDLGAKPLAGHAGVRLDDHHVGAGGVQCSDERLVAAVGAGNSAGDVAAGELRLSWTYSDNVHDEATITQENVEPRPGSLAMTRRPWCRLSTCLTIESPRPVPPDSRERLDDTR